MDAADIFHQGLGSVVHRPPPGPPYFARKPPIAPLPRRVFPSEGHDTDASGNRIAHTLTACCRCRQRKTRCDPALPRCLPCERSNSTCEYYDTTKGKKISRTYVVKLQEKVRQLENDLAFFTDEDGEYSGNVEDMVQPGGMVRLGEKGETPRYLGPSSGIAMTRLLMEEAKRYTDSQRISELIPDLIARRRRPSEGTRSGFPESMLEGHAEVIAPEGMPPGSMLGGPPEIIAPEGIPPESMQGVQDVVGSRRGSTRPGGLGSRESRGSLAGKNYPMVSAVAAQNLPSRTIMNKLAEVFTRFINIFVPVLHETKLSQHIEDVYDGDTDAYKLFVVRMVVAMSLEKLDTQYAGLADSYYLAAMSLLEDLIRPKDIKTLQCLVLVAHYSFLTPTRTATYYVVGLAVRICQQLGLGEEKTIALGISDAQTLDMRRRLSWIVTGIELKLACHLGRPNGFAREDRQLSTAKFFEAVDDQYITETGIQPGPSSESKLVAIHVCKMSLIQAEIRRVLYERKRPEPRHESHEWFLQMDRKLHEWRDASPRKPEWCGEWFSSAYHDLVVFLYRPSPQVPTPSPRAALQCFESSAWIINLARKQVELSTVYISWVFVLTLYGALNTLLWTLAYANVRSAHPREEVEDVVKTAMDVIRDCSERWPATASATPLYHVIARACMQSYEKAEDLAGHNDTPPSTANTDSPLETSMAAMVSVSTNGAEPGPGPGPGSQPSGPVFNTQFGFAFEPSQGPVDGGYFSPADPAYQHPTFRSSSIFHNPSTDMYGHGRRPSSFAPDFSQAYPSPVFMQSKTMNPWHEPVDEPTPSSTQTAHSSHATPPDSTAYSGQTSPSSLGGLPTPPGSLQQGGKGPLGVNTSMITNRNHDVGTSSPTPSTPGSMASSPFVGHMKGQSPFIKQEIRSPGGFSNPPPTPSPNQSRPISQSSSINNWFHPPPPPFMSPYAAFSNGSFWDGGTSGVMSPTSAARPQQQQQQQQQHQQQQQRHWSPATDGLESYTFSGRSDVGPFGAGVPFAGVGGGSTWSPAGRHGSLSQQQQTELMDVLESEGMGEIEEYLNMPGDRWD